MPRKDCAGDALKMQKSRSGAVESCATVSLNQPLGERCGRNGAFDTQNEILAASAPEPPLKKQTLPGRDRGLRRKSTGAQDKLVRGCPEASPSILRQAARSDDETHDPLLTPAEAAAHLRVSKSYLDKLRVYGGGPKFLRPSNLSR